MHNLHASIFRAAAIQAMYAAILKGGNVLILTPRPHETLMIGAQITVTVLGVKGNQGRSGVNAPKNVPVHRDEIFERVNSEGQTSNAPR